MKTVHIKVSGKVQGVFFRATAKEVAKHLSISGWIKNTDEGNVEALVTGENEPINKFIQWCNKGPEEAHVLNIIVTDRPLQSFENFKVIR